MKKRVEQAVSETILQKPVSVKIGDKEFKIEKPSISTLILVSEEISKLPVSDLRNNQIAVSTLANARHCKGIGRIVAIMILGAKAIGRQGRLKLRFWEKDKLNELSNYILDNCTSTELNDIFQQTLGRFDIGVFFSLITFLNDINLLSQTKTETTAYGQQSPAS